MVTAKKPEARLPSIADSHWPMRCLAKYPVYILYIDTDSAHYVGIDKLSGRNCSSIHLVIIGKLIVM